MYRYQKDVDGDFLEVGGDWDDYEFALNETAFVDWWNSHAKEEYQFASFAEAHNPSAFRDEVGGEVQNCGAYTMPSRFAKDGREHEYAVIHNY
jgi:hypothetical protein